MNTFGQRFRLTSFGESHGAAIGGIIDGCPSGIVLDEELLKEEMRRRHLGRDATARHEPDEVKLLSGIYEGKTLGTPIAFEIGNNDTRSQDYTNLADCYRPGHADYSWEKRFGRRDPRGGGRASARETAVRVAAGAIAKMFLRTKGVEIEAEITVNALPDKKEGFGGIIHCTIRGVPSGIGNPVFGKLNAALASAMMSIPSAIGFEMGLGFTAAHYFSSIYVDNWNTGFTTATNHCGGIQGGISNGMPIEFNVAFHPIVTVNGPMECITSKGKLKTVVIKGRHDMNHIPRTVVIVEAMAALTMADYFVGIEN